jgi:hypothetical protein
MAYIAAVFHLSTVRRVAGLPFWYTAGLEIGDKIVIKPGETRCPRCFGRDVSPSRPRGLLDAIMRRLGRAPRHCRFCEKRFYVRIPDASRAEF